jgi:FKBP-type peptidyl-prolyl cis-trans isomerase
MSFVVLCTLKNMHGKFETRVHVFPFIYRTKMLNSVKILKWKYDKKKVNKILKKTRQKENKNRQKQKQKQDKNKNKSKTWKTMSQNIKYHEPQTNQCWVKVLRQGRQYLSH